MKTGKTIRPLNISTPQARRLLDCGEVLVVEACKKQPEGGLIRPVINRQTGRLHDYGLDERIFSPYVPGDVVPCYSGRRPFKWVSWGGAVVASVKCRRVETITNAEAKRAGFVEGTHPVGHASYFAFADDWNTRHRRRGPEYEFGRAWAFFTTLKMGEK